MSKTKSEEILAVIARESLLCKDIMQRFKVSESTARRYLRDVKSGRFNQQSGGT